MAASPYDRANNTQRNTRDDIRRRAASRLKTVSDLERRRGELDQLQRQQKQASTGGEMAPSTTASGRGGERVSSLKTLEQAQSLKRLAAQRARINPDSVKRDTEAYWRMGLGQGATPARMQTRGAPIVRGNKMFYRRKSDGKAIPIDSTGKVIRG